MQSEFNTAERLITHGAEEVLAQLATLGIDGVVEIARSQGVSALVLDALKQNADAQTSVQTNSLQIRLAEQTRLNALKHTCLRNWLLEFAGFVKSKNIPALVLKGMALSERVYKNPNDRPKTDVDLMVKERDVETLRNHFLAQGFIEVLDTGGRFAGHHQLAFEKKVSGELSISIDVHWRLTHNQSFTHAPDFEELWNNAASFSDEPDADANLLRMPSLFYLALHSVIHYYGHHYDSPRLIWVYDLHLTLNAMDEAQRQTFLKLVENKKISNLAREMMLLAQRCFKTDSATEIIRALEQNAGAERTDYLLNRSLPRRRYFLHQFMAFDGAWAKLGYLKELLLPSRDYMKKRYGLTTNYQLPVQYLKRMFGAAN